MLQKKAFLAIVKFEGDITEYFLRTDSTPENYQTSSYFSDKTMWRRPHDRDKCINDHAEKIPNARFFSAEIVLLEFHDNIW